MEVFDPQRPGARILVIATEWRSRHGGLSSFNRGLCAALADAGQQVVCLVPEHDREEASDAKARGITLLRAVDELAVDELVRLRKRPVLGLAEPQIIIGHGRITGPAARSLQEDLYPSATRVHVVHTFPASIEWFKGPGPTGTRMMKAADREKLERDLGESAGVVAAVGPLLARETEGMMGRAVLELLPGVQEVANERPALPATVRCLLTGRAEDEELKGLDIAARAFGRLDAGSGANRRLLVVQGAQVGDGDDLASRLAKLAGGRLKVHVAPYSADADAVARELARASLSIMPSRSEGFGLVGLEAIAAGVPVLVSGNSGLGELLSGLGGSAAQCVVPVDDDEDRDAERWAEAIEDVLEDRVAAFEAARAVREQVAACCAWSNCAATLLAEMNLPAVPVPVQGRSAPVVCLPDRDRSFFGRVELLEHLDEVLGDSAKAAVVALVGEEGVGRGALALEAAWRRRELYDLVWSLDGPPEALNDTLAEVGRSLGLAQDCSTHQPAEAALEWLTHKDNRWLLLVEGEHSALRLSEKFHGILPGHVLVVGDAPGAYADEAVAVEVGPFSDEEAANLLMAHGGDQDEDGARALAAALGNRPLAVRTAAAYLDEGEYTIKQLTARLADAAPALFGGDGDSRDAVIEMLRLSHDELSRQPLASEAVNLAAFLDDAPIPFELLSSLAFAPVGFAGGNAEEGAQAASDLALGIAEGFGQFVRSGHTVRLSAEVARRTRQELGDQAGVWASQAVASVLATMRSAVGADARRLVGHAVVATELAMRYFREADLIGLPAHVAAVRVRAASLMAEAGEHTEAERTLAPVIDFLMEAALQREPVDVESYVAVERMRAFVARETGDTGVADKHEQYALDIARESSIRPPITPGISCELLLTVLNERASHGDIWYGALAFRGLQASAAVIVNAEKTDVTEVSAAVQLRRRIADYLAKRGQFEDVVSVVEPLLSLPRSPDLQHEVSRAAELSTTALQEIGGG